MNSVIKLVMSSRNLAYVTGGRTLNAMVRGNPNLNVS
jgi:hypothetical protein